MTAGQPALRRLASRLERALEHLLALLMGVMVLDVVFQVTSRYALGRPSSFTEELARFLLIWIGLLGGALAARRGLHTALDLVPGRLAPRHRRRMERLTRWVIAAFAAAVLGAGGAHLVATTFALGQRSPALGVPMGAVYLALPLAGALVALFALTTESTPAPP